MPCEFLMPYEEIKRKNRKKILTVLSGESKSFGELKKSLDLSPPALSTHLKELEEEGEVVSRRDSSDRRKRIYWRAGLGEGRSREFIVRLDSQLNGSLTINQREEIQGLLTNDVLDALEGILEQTKEVRIWGYEGLEAKLTTLDAVWIWRAKDEIKGEEIESVATDKEILMRAFPVLRSVNNKILGKAIEEVKDQAKVNKIITREKNKISKIAKKNSVEEKLNELFELLHSIVLEDGKDSVAYLNMVKTREVFSYRFGFEVQTEIIGQYGKALGL